MSDVIVYCCYLDVDALAVAEERGKRKIGGAVVVNSCMSTINIYVSHLSPTQYKLLDLKTSRGKQKRTIHHQPHPYEVLQHYHTKRQHNVATRRYTPNLIRWSRAKSRASFYRYFVAATSTDPSQTPSDDDSEVWTKAMIARCVNVKKSFTEPNQ